MKSPIKWAGGKSWLVGRLADLYADHLDKRFVEPFMGSCAATLALEPKAALCADVLAPLVNFFQHLRLGLAFDPADYTRTESEFYGIRERFNAIYRDGGTEAARLFYYLNRRAFNGLCRFSAKGTFNAPWGKYKTEIPPLADYSAALMNVEFRRQHFAKTLLQCGASDFIYVDPPYDTEFTSYAAGGFTWADQVHLADLLAAHAAPVVVSNQATDRVLALYRMRGFDVETLPAPRKIACTGDRRPALEMLALRNVTVAQRLEIA